MRAIVLLSNGTYELVNDVVSVRTSLLDAEDGYTNARFNKANGKYVEVQAPIREIVIR